MTFPVKHISLYINVPPKKVYEYAADPANLPAWAGGLSTAVKKEGEAWLAESPLGPIKIKFAQRNSFGILDHYVTLPTGATINNPMRVIPNGSGSEVVFTLFRREEMSAEQFLADAAAVAKDLGKLKQILEK